MVLPKICGSSVWNLLHVTLLMPRIWKWLLDCLIICATLGCDMCGVNWTASTV